MNNKCYAQTGFFAPGMRIGVGQDMTDICRYRRALNGDRTRAWLSPDRFRARVPANRQRWNITHRGFRQPWEYFIIFLPVGKTTTTIMVDERS